MDSTEAHFGSPNPTRRRYPSTSATLHLESSVIRPHPPRSKPVLTGHESPSLFELSDASILEAASTWSYNIE